MIIYFNIKHLFLLCTVLFFNITDGMDLQSTIPSPSLLGLPDLIDKGLVHISIQRPPSPQRGDSKWADVELVNDCIIAYLDLNPDANLLDKLIRSDETLSTAENISSLTNGPLTTHETPINLAVSDQSLELNIDAQDHLTQTAISSDAEITYTAHREAPEVNFSDLTAYDQRHVIDHGVASASQDTYYSNAHKNHLNGSRQLNRVEQIERLECLISSSSDPKSLATQIDISLGRVGLSPKIFRDDIQTQYRAFLFDSANHFKPINTIGRQQQALEIVYPAIKAYFGRDQKGLVQFLEKHAMQGTPGFQKLLDLETGKASYGDHLSNFGKNCSSSMASLNIFHSPPTIEGIKKSHFIEDFSKLVSLVKAKQLPEAKALLDQFRAKIFTTPLAQRQAKIEEYNCLCKQYDALLEKCFNSYRNDPQYQRCLGPLTRGTMQKVEALKLLEARDYAFKSIAYKMGFEPHNLSNYDKSLIYKTIDSKIKDTYGLKDLYEHKDLLNDKDLANLKEKLEFFTHSAQANSENAAVARLEETEPIEPLKTAVEQEVSITTSPPPLEPKEPKEKTEKVDSQNKDIKREGIKQTSIYKNALGAIGRNTHRFTKLGLELLSKDKLKHIINNHYKIGEVSKQRASNSIFNENIDLIDIILTALEFGAETDPGVITYDCGKIIGHSSNGNPTSIIQVCLDKTKSMIKTSFPG